MKFRRLITLVLVFAMMLSFLPAYQTAEAQGSVTVHDRAGLVAAIAAAPNNGDVQVIELADEVGNFYFPEAVLVMNGRNILLRSAGSTPRSIVFNMLNPSVPPRHFIVDGENSSLTLENVTLDGRYTTQLGAAVQRGGVVVRNGGSLTMGESSTITRTFWSTTGGFALNSAVYVSLGGSFAMLEGSALNDNHVSNAVVGVTGEESSFIMEGGAIHNNPRGAVSVAGGARFDMTGTAIIRNNRHTSIGIESTVFVNGVGSVFYMTGTATIANNLSASDWGNADKTGGVRLVNGAEFTMSGNAQIRDNTAEGFTAGTNVPGNTWRAGGVILSGGSSFTMEENASITNNIARGQDSAGGVLVRGQNTSFTMEGGVIAANTSTLANSAGGIHVSGQDASFVMEDGTILGNSGNTGGGVRVTNGNFIMHGGRIDANSSNTNGGGIWADNIDDAVEVFAGSIQNNTAALDGGAIWTQRYNYNEYVLDTDYNNISIHAPSVFTGNRARDASQPPANPEVLTHIDFAQSSVDTFHLLNNFDINYRRIPVETRRVTFVGAQGVAETVAVLYNTAVTQPPNPTWAEWKFIGWFATETDIEPFDFDTPIVVDTVLISRWESALLPSHPVTFVANGGSGTMTTASVEEGAQFTLPQNEFTAPTSPAGREFTGWLVSGNSPEAGAILRQAGFSITVNGPVALTAQWSPGNDVQQPPNGGTPPISRPPVADYEAHLAYMRGNHRGEFRPSDSLTRAEAAAILVRTQVRDFAETTNFLPPAFVTGFSEFRDVNPGDWFYFYVAWAYAADLVQGFGGEFRPDDPVTREELAAMIARTGDLHPVATLGFNDATQISSWALVYVNTVYRNGLMIGNTQGNFRPRENITRAETATAINRLLGRIDSRAAWDAAEIENPEAARNFSDVGSGAWYFPSVVAAANDHNLRRDAEGTITWKQIVR